MTRRRLSTFGLAVAVAALTACSEEAAGPGIAVSVDLNGFGGQVVSLKIALYASPDGFQPHALEPIDQGGNVETEDVDGDGALELVVRFTPPRAPVSFRVETGNQIDLTVRGQATAFDAQTVIAGADGADTTLLAGGRGTIALTLQAQTGGSIGPDTRTTDLRTVAADHTIGTSEPGSLSAVAVCDIDGDDLQDLVIGAPQAEYLGLAVGGVYVLFGGGGFGRDIDIVNPTTVTEFHFFGEFAGDQLGGAVACADLTDDGVDDLIVGAPGAGSIYAVFGAANLQMRQVLLGTTGATAPDVTWETAAGGGFGAMLFATDLDGDRRAEILASAPADQKVHLLAGVTGRQATPINVDGADHVTFSGVRATALGAGDLRALGGRDIVIGDANAKMPGSSETRGAIYAFGGVPLAGTTQYDLAATEAALRPDLIIYGEVDSQFGAAVVVLDTTGGRQDLIVGAPGFNQAAGAIFVYESDSALYDVSPRPWNEFAKSKEGPIAFGRFGAALAGSPAGNGPDWTSYDLVVGAYATERGGDRPLAGAAYLFGGGPGWLFPLYEQVFGASAGDQLGAVVAGGPINGSDPDGDLVAVAPGAADGRGIVYVRFNHFVQQ